MYRINVDSSQFELTKADIEKLDIVSKDNILHLLEGNTSATTELLDIDLDRKIVILKVNGKEHTIVIEDDLDLLIDKLGFSSEANLVIKDIKAPMPGLVLDILVKEGDQVEKDSQLLILEAMKMENLIKSPSDGIVKEIIIKKGEAVEKGQLLISLD